MSERRCGNCRFFDRLGPRARRGDCRHPAQTAGGVTHLWGGGLALMGAERAASDACQMHAHPGEEIASDRVLAAMRKAFATPPREAGGNREKT